MLVAFKLFELAVCARSVLISHMTQIHQTLDSLLPLESRGLLLIQRRIYELSALPRELPKLVQVNLHVLALIEEVAYQLEHVHQTALQHLLVNA